MGLRIQSLKGLTFTLMEKESIFMALSRLICQQDHTGAVLRMESRGQGQMQCDR